MCFYHIHTLLPFPLGSCPINFLPNIISSLIFPLNQSTEFYIRFPHVIPLQPESPTMVTCERKKRDSPSPQQPSLQLAMGPQPPAFLLAIF